MGDKFLTGFIYAEAEFYQCMCSATDTITHLQRIYSGCAVMTQLGIEYLGEIPFCIEQGAIKIKEYSFSHSCQSLPSIVLVGFVFVIQFGSTFNL